VPEEEEPGDDLPECVDYQPSSFERGKPRSILSLLLYAGNLLYISSIYCCIRLYELSELLMHLLLSLPTLLYSYPTMFRIE
jgi:hypothetical protein